MGSTVVGFIGMDSGKHQPDQQQSSRTGLFTKGSLNKKQQAVGKNDPSLDDERDRELP